MRKWMVLWVCLCMLTLCAAGAQAAGVTMHMPIQDAVQAILAEMQKKLS